MYNGYAHVSYIGINPLPTFYIALTHIIQSRDVNTPLSWLPDYAAEFHAWLQEEPLVLLEMLVSKGLASERQVESVPGQLREMVEMEMSAWGETVKL
jgi:hypothetical protein